MTRMKVLSELPVDVLVGGPLEDLQCQPMAPYSGETIDCLSRLSAKLLDLPDVRAWPDVVTFAYWCRASNLGRLRDAFDKRLVRIGRGLAFHVAPSNVPVNFAYSLAFGMLAGNANIVRVPSAGFPQVDLIAEALRGLFANPEYARVAAMNRLIRYPRNRQVNQALSAASHARVVWGGDATIAEMRSIPTPPRCVDVSFPDRYSLCVLGADHVANIESAALTDLARKFYNDAFLLDQNACSSPRLVVWLGDGCTAELAMNRFWSAVRKTARRRRDGGNALSVERFIQVCEVGLQFESYPPADWRGGELSRVRLTKLANEVEDIRGRHGFFAEYVTDRLDSLTPIVTERFQTIAYCGVLGRDIQDWVLREGLLGIDRVVPVGSALDMGPVWDGLDLIASLSRIIADI